MANRPQVKIAIKISDYNGVAALAQQIHDQMVINVADFPTPVPSMANFQTQINTLVTNLANWGPQGNRGSHADLVAVRTSCNVVYTSMILLGAFVQNLVDPTLSYPDQTAFILSSGFAVKNSPSPQGVLSAPVGLVQLIQSAVPLNTPKLKWSKPIDLLSPNNVKSYKIFRRRNVDGSPTMVIGYTTKTSFIDATATGNAQYEYWVAGVNTNGEGVACPSILISVPL